MLVRVRSKQDDICYCFIGVGSFTKIYKVEVHNDFMQKASGSCFG
jgi:hypothetical protein